MITLRTCEEIIAEETKNKLYKNLNDHLISLDDSAFESRGLGISGHLTEVKNSRVTYQVSVFTKVNAVIVGSIATTYSVYSTTPQLNIQQELDNFIIKFDTELGSCAFEKSGD